LDLKLEISEWGVCRTHHGGQAYGAWLLYAIAFPALTGWANFFRAYGAFGIR